MSKEIITKDPNSWNSSDQEMLWQSERSSAGSEVLGSQKTLNESLKRLMIPLAVVCLCVFYQNILFKAPPLHLFITRLNPFKLANCCFEPKFTVVLSGNLQMA
ncbi:hypothetical protein COOONC_21126 [Cooperia oncophora]